MNKTSNRHNRFIKQGTTGLSAYLSSLILSNIYIQTYTED